MTAQHATYQQLLSIERSLEPTFEPHPRLSRSRLALVLIVTLVAVLVALGHDGVAHAAHAVCTIGEPAGATCGEVLVHVGYP